MNPRQYTIKGSGLVLRSEKGGGGGPVALGRGPLSVAPPSDRAKMRGRGGRSGKSKRGRKSMGNQMQAASTDVGYAILCGPTGGPSRGSGEGGGRIRGQRGAAAAGYARRAPVGWSKGQAPAPARPNPGNNNDNNTNSRGGGRGGAVAVGRQRTPGAGARMKFSGGGKVR